MKVLFLLIGNDGAILAEISKGQVVQSWSADKDNKAELDDLEAVLKQNSKYPLRIIIDLLEQNYNHESLPAASLLDRSKMIKRRLSMCFPYAAASAALALGKNDELKDINESKKQKYLFAALPNSAEWQFWQDFIEKTGAKPLSLSLLPLEGVLLVERLHKILAEHGEFKAESIDENKNIVEKGAWRLLICPQETGGLRQIITHNGELILTRNTPLDDDICNDSQKLFAEIKVEIIATETYLKRLDYNASDGLDIIIITDYDIKDNELAKNGIDSHNVTMLDVETACKLLKIAKPPKNNAKIKGAGFLFINWRASLRRPQLNLLPHSLKKESRRRKYLRLFLHGQIVLFVLFVIITAWVMYDTNRLRGESVNYSSYAASLNKETSDMENKGADSLSASPNLISASFYFDEEFREEVKSPENILDIIDGIIGEDAVISSYNWEERPVENNRRSRRQNIEPHFELILDLRLDNIDNPINALTIANEFVSSLETSFAGSVATITRFPLDADPEHRFSGQANDGEVSLWQSNPSIEITLNGASSNDYGTMPEIGEAE